MISRTLVPRDVKPINPDELKKAGTRFTTYMDDRMVVPSGPSDAPPLDGKTSIPAHMPLGVLVETTLVPRGMPVKPIERSVETQEKGAMALEVLDSRTLVPAHVKPLQPEQRQEFAPIDAEKLRDVIEPDIFITGDANLLIEAEEKHNAKWDNLSRIGSIAAHILLILFLINVGRIFKSHVPTSDEEALAQKQLGGFIYLPPATPTPTPPIPKMPKIDPKLLQPAPVEKPPEPAPVQPTPLPQPVKPAPDLPEAPTPHNVQPNLPVPPPPPQVTPNTPLQPSQLDPIKPHPNNHLNLKLPNESPGQTLQDQLNDAIKRQPAGSYSSQSTLKPSSGGSSRAGADNVVTILSPTYGVDFRSYVQRMLDTIKRNWAAVMPESALLGDTGEVVITFQINADGSVQAPDPTMERTSSKPPLDSAAMSSIRASNPFEPLPKDFLDLARAQGHEGSMRFGIVFIYCGYQPCPTH